MGTIFKTAIPDRGRCLLGTVSTEKGVTSAVFSIATAATDEWPVA